MGIKRYKPTSSARRFMTVSSYEEITCTTPERSLLEDQKHKAGRNAQGKITVRHHGGGNKRKYRIIDFKRDRDGISAVVKTIEYDPNRTANIPTLETIPVEQLNTYDVVKNAVVVLAQSAVEKLEEVYGE